jgi:DNA-binding transcriptional ArsR family regulator
MKKIIEKSKFFKALGDPVRLQIINYLLDRQFPVCICNLSKVINRDQSVVFRHVQLLVAARIVNTKKDNKFLMCSIQNKAKIKNLIDLR